MRPSRSAETEWYFITNVIFRDLKKSGVNPAIYANNKNKLTEVYQRVCDLLAEDAPQRPSLEIGEVHTGLEYELFCRNVLEEGGWQVLTTPVTGDQGADLIATKANLRVVIQCKFYSQPVGNKAVQEVFAAQRFQQAQYAVVVTNNSFTASARQLATTNGVYLLHHDQLGGLENLLQAV